MNSEMIFSRQKAQKAQSRITIGTLWQIRCSIPLVAAGRIGLLSVRISQFREDFTTDYTEYTEYTDVSRDASPSRPRARTARRAVPTCEFSIRVIRVIRGSNPFVVALPSCAFCAFLRQIIVSHYP